jgi:hypothetical protein
VKSQQKGILLGAFNKRKWITSSYQLKKASNEYVLLTPIAIPV